MDRWCGKTAVVTGAGSGIGAGIAIALANAGIKVIGLDLQTRPVEELSKKVTGNGSIIPRLCNISKPEEIADTFKWIVQNHGGVHILVNNAGFMCVGNITDVGSDTLTEEQIISTLDTNIKGTVLCTRHAIAFMKSNGVDGHIININSIAGHYIPFSSAMNVYPTTKHAITAFTLSLNQELADYKNKIKVTSVSPGLTSSNMSAHLLELELPILQPSDIADAVLYALSTPSRVNIGEITVTPVMEKRQ